MESKIKVAGRKVDLPRRTSAPSSRLRKKRQLGMLIIFQARAVPDRIQSRP